VNRRFDIVSFLWGTVFLIIAGLGAWRALNLPMDGPKLMIAIPVLLIMTSVLGLMLGRTKAELPRG